jgi:hypothetical protein
MKSSAPKPSTPSPTTTAMTIRMIFNALLELFGGGIVG